MRNRLASVHDVFGSRYPLGPLSGTLHGLRGGAAFMSGMIGKVFGGVLGVVLLIAIVSIAWPQRSAPLPDGARTDR